MEERELAALAKKAKAGDSGAFERLFSEHVSAILFHARNLLIDKESYTDVAQDVALKMFENIHSLREPAAFRGWMHQIIRSVCADHNRRYIRQEKRVDLTEDDDVFETIVDEGAETNPESITMAGLEGNWLLSKVSELPPTYREIITQFYAYEMSYKEIAEAQGLSVSGVSSRLQRAMDAMRQIVRDENEGSSAGDRATSKATMKEDTTHTPLSEDGLNVSTDPHLDEKGLSDDIGLRNSFAAAMAVVASDDTTKAVLTSVHEKIIVAASATTITGAAGAAAAAGKGVTIVGIIFSSVTLTVALALGGLALYSEGGTRDVESGELTQKYVVHHQYQGTLHISFVNTQGEDGDHDVVSAHLVDEGPELTQVTWEIYELAGGAEALGAGAHSEYAAEAGDIKIPEGASLVQSGSGSTIDSTVLLAMGPGSYQVIFSIQDTTNAQAEITRTFTVLG